MRSCFWFLLFSALVVSGSVDDSKKAPKETALTSIYPFAVVRGNHLKADVRGTALDGARALIFEKTGITAAITGVVPVASDGSQTAHVDVAVTPDAEAGWHRFRLVTRGGVTNELRVMVVDEPVLSGRIERNGDVSNHWIDAKAGETLTIEAMSGFKSFDPTLSLFEETSTWFDPHRVVRLAFNDDPLPFPGLSTDARLVHRFDHAGKYCIQVGSFDGKGGPDYSYFLRINHGVAQAPPLHPEAKAAWEERRFTRTITPDWVTELARRGGAEEPQPAVETFHAVPEGSAQIPFATLPALIEGRIAKPGETHIIKVKIDKPQDIAIEVETPQATLPRFNPVIRLLQPDGYEIATDVYTKLNNNGLYMMKMIESKTAFSLRAPGDYMLAIRDITTGCAGDDFAYRVLVRRQTPHVGAVDIGTDHLNLEPGTVKPVAIKIDREEGFSGYIVVNVRDLPVGVTAFQAMENPVETPPLPNGGRAERYFAKEQSTSVVLTAAPDAAISSMPVKARIELSVVNKGKLGPVIASREIPVMVVERRP
jgi:hypothetical protein